MAKSEADDKSVMQSKQSVSKKRIVACIVGGLLLVLAGIGILSFVGALFSGFRPWIGDGGQLVFQAGIAIVGWGLIDTRRRKQLIVCTFI